jgi:hypothetical protein
MLPASTRGCLQAGVNLNSLKDLTEPTKDFKGIKYQALGYAISPTQCFSRGERGLILTYCIVHAGGKLPPPEAYDIHKRDLLLPKALFGCFYHKHCGIRPNTSPSIPLLHPRRGCFGGVTVRPSFASADGNVTCCFCGFQLY